MDSIKKPFIPIIVGLSLFNSSQANDYRPRETPKAEVVQRDLYQNTDTNLNHYQR